MVRKLVALIRRLTRRRPARVFTPDPFHALVCANWTWQERRVLFEQARAGMLAYHLPGR